MLRRTKGRLKRRVAHVLRRITRGATGRRDTARELFTLAWPIAAAMAGETLMGLVDTKLVGGLGPSALGGVGVAMTVVFLGYMLVFGLMRGVKVCVAHAVGRGEGHVGVRYAQAGILLGLGAGVLYALGMRDAAPLFRVVGIDPGVIPQASAFLSAFTFGAPGSCVLSAMTQYRQGVGDSRTPMVVGLGGNLVNGVLGWSLIYGHLGLPALGIRGSGYATATTEWIEAAVMLALLVRDVRASGHYARARAELPMRSALREVCALGVPTGVQFGSETLAFATFTALLGAMGAEQIAAHQIALAVIRTSFLPGAAVAEAASVLVGNALGRRSLRDADRATRSALGMAVSFMAVCGVVFAVAGGFIATSFTADPAVARVARTLLWIAAGFQVLDAANLVLRGALRGARDVRVPMILGVGIVWTCVPTAAFFLGRLVGWGAVGGWCGFLVETTLGATLFAVRWKKGAWRADYA
jgi:MATE family multidrug resistance protein